MVSPHPEDFLPLTPLAFEILLALAEGEAHGYALTGSIEDRSRGAVNPHPGTLYKSIARLLQDGLVEELPGPAVQGEDRRRRYYRITSRGRRVAAAEAARLESQVRAARARRLRGAG